MSDTTDISLAMRSHADALLVCTTGTTTLSATAGGYARAAGSFIDDGFAVGMEVVPSGFPQTSPALITKVTALDLFVFGGRTVAAAAAARSLTVGLPTDVVYPNNDYTPVANRQYVELSCVPATSQLTSYPARGGTRERTGLFVALWFGIPNTGEKGIGRCVDALEALFAPHTPITMPDGSTLKVRGDVGPSQSEITRRGAHAMRVLTIPWVHYAPNVIAA